MLQNSDWFLNDVEKILWILPFIPVESINV